MQSSKILLRRVDAINELEDIFMNAVETNLNGGFIPTGLQEETILAFGRGKHEILLDLKPNDAGKTATGAQILKNLIWPHDPVWFSWWPGYSIFRDRTFMLKTFRITAQHTNLTEEGAIQTEIARWWPAGKYQWMKGGQHYPSKCTCDTGWSGDALSYNQGREEHESKKISVLWSDEPPNPDLLGAMTSRFSEGMLWLITATPVKCGAFLDLIKDMEEAGTTVKRLTGTAWENSTNPEKGKPNHLKTKYGLRSDQEILSKIARCPKDERDARIFGKESNKAGKRYPTFNRDMHVRYFDLGSSDVRLWNCYMSMDPHPKHYNFIQWWAVTPDEKHVCYNEWPTYEMFGRFYDEIRNDLQNPYSVEDLCKFIKIFDGTQYGMHIVDRFIDPFYGLGVGDISKGTTGLLQFYAEHDIILSLPPRQQIDVQHERINSLLKYDPQIPTSEPQMFFMPHCVNSIRMMERHYWDEEKEMEAPKYKEGSDCVRIFEAGLADRGYMRLNEEAATGVIENSSILDILHRRLPDINLG